MTGVVTEQLGERVLELCKEAGDAILAVYNQKAEIDIQSKDDSSPLTEADLASHHVLVGGLEGLLDGVPVLSEEGDIPTWGERQYWQRYWIIDPLDGTKEFIKRSGEFTVNVALIENGRPVLGVVFVPVLNVGYSGLQDGGAYRHDATGSTPITVRRVQALIDTKKPVALVASRNHGAEEVTVLMSRLEEDLGATVETTNMGSSLKLCLVAEGKADLYPRLALTCEWDTAAAQAVVEAAGGEVWTDLLEPMRYNSKEELLNPYFYVVGDTSFPWRELLKNVDS